MTAEIVIANGSGVALAADSAVTIGNQKIYNSAIKVFSLSKVHPVGIMIFGNASLLSVPWEIIIKSYRSGLKKKSFHSVEKYAEDFLKFVATSPKFQNMDSQKLWIHVNVRGYFMLIRDDFFKKTHPILETKGEITETEVNALLKDVISQHYASIQKIQLIDGIDSNFEKKIRKKYTSLFSQVKNEVFQQTKIAKSLISKLYDIATLIHTREIFAASTSGIVIAGYGDDDIYPTVLSYKIEGIIDGKLKHKKDKAKSYKISSGNDCTIIPFAQEEMVFTFMNGIDPNLADLISNYMRQIFARIPELAKDKKFELAIADSVKFKEVFDEISAPILDDFFEKFRIHINEKQIQPIMSMVRVLPKDELASMAETLVNLTAFKRKVSNSLETVGGPVDVAVISMGDGLVWVKRKHYFPKELNNHFFDNYFREVTGE